MYADLLFQTSFFLATRAKSVVNKITVLQIQMNGRLKSASEI